MEEKKGFFGSVILYNLAWLISSLFTIVDLFMVREAALDILTAIQQNLVEKAPSGEQAIVKMQFGNTIELVDRGILFLGGVLVVAIAIGIEYYFRKGQESGTVWKRVGKVFAIIAAVFVVCLLIQILI